jgi:hydrogenase-4 component B
VTPAARTSSLARSIAALLALSGALLAALGAVSLGHTAPRAAVGLPSPFPPLLLQLDPLAAGGAVLAGVLFFATGLLRAAGVGAGGPGTGLLLWLLLLAVAWFLASDTPLGLLLGWEALSIAGYFALIRDRPRVRRAAWALLGLSEFGTGLLFFALLLLAARGPAGGDTALGPAWATALALLALFAFGAKAGLFPLQVWVPLAEPEAPGDLAGLFSGLLTAVAFLGYLRLLRMVTPPLFPAGVVTGLFGLLGAGASALLGLIERDAKRVLAYGTLEALGLCFTALGVGMVLQARGAGSAAVVAVDGALTLLVAHAGAKFALFSLAGWVEETAGVRLLDRMGGLLGRLPRAAGPLLLAVCTVAGLPPLGGFLGEWLLVEACLMPTPADPGLHVALAILAALVALVAAIGLTLYLRWLGIGFLGAARTPAAARVPDVPVLGAVGQWLAALVGTAAGVGAGWILPWLGAALSWLVQGQPVVAPTYLDPKSYAPIVALGAALFRGVAGSTGNVIFAAGGFDVASPWDLGVFGLLLGLAVALATGRLRPRQVRLVRPWVGGEPDDSLRLTWTAEALNHPLRLTFATFFGLQRTRLTPGGPAVESGHIRYRARVVLRLEHHVYRPLLEFAARASGAVRHAAQSGDVGRYVGYLLGAVLVGLTAVLLGH